MESVWRDTLPRYDPAAGRTGSLEGYISALSDLGGTMWVMAARITAQVGASQVVKVRLDPTAAQAEMLRGYCGTARAVYNTLLYRVKINLAQRASERSYGLEGNSLTPAIGWHKCSLERLLREHRDEWSPWWTEVPWQVLDLPAQQLAAGLAKFTAGTARFPTFKRKHGPNAGLVPVTFRDSSVTWIAGGGRIIALPVPLARRRELGSKAATKLSRVRAVKDNRARKAAALARVQKLHGRALSVPEERRSTRTWRSR
jgi:hypothetical protein